VALGNRIGIVIDGRPFLYAGYGGHHGFQYGGADTGDAFDTAIERVAQAYEHGSARGDRYRAHAARSMRLPVGHEGKASAINTYDATILTVGAGFARERLDRWLRSLAGTPAGDALAEIPYLSGLRFDRSNTIRLDIEALNRIAAAIETNSVAVAEAQVREYVRASALNPRHAGLEHLDRLDAFADGTLRSQPHGDAVLGVATYLHHGQPGYTPDPGIDAQEAMHRYPDSPWAQTAEICRRHAERIWRARKNTGGLAARTVTARLPNKLRLVAQAIGEPINGTVMAAIAPCMNGAQFTAEGPGHPDDPDGRVFLVNDGQWYDFGCPAERRPAGSLRRAPAAMHNEERAEVVRSMQRRAANRAVQRLLLRAVIEDPVEDFELRFHGAAGEVGIGALFVEDWAALRPEEQQVVLVWMREADRRYGARIGDTRRRVTNDERRRGSAVAKTAREALGLAAGVASGHIPDMAGGAPYDAPQVGLPARINSSIGGQWGRYQPEFVFAGLSLYDADTGEWLYLSRAHHHEPARPEPQRPKRGTEPGSIARRVLDAKSADRTQPSEPPGFR
jgi:hypothetical protein